VSRAQRLVVVLVLNLALVAALLVVGVTAHSVGVLAAGGDYVLDAAAVAIALIALALSRRPATDRRPGGHPNALNIAALVNGGWLLVLEMLVAGAAADRLITGTPDVHGLPVLVVSGVAAAVMVVAAMVLGGDDDDDDLSMKAVLLDTIADAAAAAGVAVVGLVIFVTGGWFWLDPAVALVIAVVVGYHALRLVMTVVGRLRNRDRRSGEPTQLRP
jgi:cobalt-zinc-cadmium efflux system protein